MPTSKRAASVRTISSSRKKPRFSSTTGKGHKQPASQKQNDDSASEEEPLDEKDQDAQPSTGHTLGPLGGNTPSI